MFLQAFWARQLFAALAQLTVETVPDRARAWPDYFDNTEGIGAVARPRFYKDRRSGLMLPFKGRAEEVSPDEKLGVEAHITATAFGTRRKRRAFWKKKLQALELPQEIIDRYGQGFEGDELADRTAERMALHERFWKVPYHWVGLLNGDVLYNNQITRYTNHGNGGNRRLIGVAAEANLPGLERQRKKKHHGLDEHFIETNRAALRLAVLKGREKGAPVARLYAHRQYADGRRGDPGEGWWKEIGIPVAGELHLDRMTHYSHGSGSEICQEWDDTGRVNYYGRRVA